MKIGDEEKRGRKIALINEKNKKDSVVTLILPFYPKRITLGLYRKVIV